MGISFQATATEINGIWEKLCLFYCIVRVTLHESFQLIKTFFKKTFNNINLSQHFACSMSDFSDSRLHSFTVSSSLLKRYQYAYQQDELDLERQKKEKRNQVFET